MLEAKIIGDKIAKARKKLNISQAQLAERLFISPQAVGKWERGESMPDIVTFNRLAEILGVDLNYFSESTQATTAEMASTESFKQSPSEEQNQRAGKSEKKLSWNMSRGNWVDADFSGLKNLHEKFSSSNIQRCLFIGSDLSGLLLKSNHVEGCDFSRSDISNSLIQNSHLSNNLFKDCSLKEAEFSGSAISGCDFSDTNFTEAKFKSAAFLNNRVPNALWNHTSFIDTQIADVVFEGTIDDCYFENCSFKKVTFQNAVLVNTFFKTKSLKSIQFIDCKADKMTYEFLKNGKADLTGITLLTP